MRFAAVCLATLVSACAADAQCRNAVVTRTYIPAQHAQTYTYDSVAVPIALPLVIPAYSFQYVPPACAPAKPVQTEFQLAAPAPPLRKEDIRDIVRQVIEESRRTDPEDDGPPVNTSPVRRAPIQYLQQEEPKRPNPRSAFAQSAVNALHRNCATCHTGFAGKGDAVIFSSGTVINENAPFASMLKEIRTGHMPPKHTGLKPTDQEINVMVAWLEGR